LCRILYVNTLALLKIYPFKSNLMKNKYPLAIIALLFSVVFTLFSCSKDTLDPTGGSPAGNPASTNKTVPDFQQFDPPAVTTGALVIQVAPLEAKAVVTVYNDQFTSGPYAMNVTEGILVLDNLEPGLYKVQIKPINPEFLPMLIENIEIISGTKTDIGTIILGN
jgi:hypothetical protein